MTVDPIITLSALAGIAIGLCVSFTLAYIMACLIMREGDENQLP